MRTSGLVASANTTPDPPCTLDPVRDGPWYPSVVSFEHFDSGRTHAFRCARFGGRMDGPNIARVAAVLPDRYPTPYNLVLRERGRAFVYGGAYGDIPGAPGSFVAGVDTTTSAQVWRTQLVDAAADPSAWNYPGVVSVLRDGMVYVIYGTKLSKLDPGDGRVVATVALPTLGSPKDTAYNGFNGFADGRIVAKTVNRQAGCLLQGFSAFMECPDAEDVPNSLVVVVDPESMSVLSQVEADEQIGGRLTTTRHDGADHLYLPGRRSMYRYTWDGAALVRDAGWGPVEFIREGQSPAPAAAVIGGWVVLQTNAIPASEAMSVVAIRQSDGKKSEIQPFADMMGPLKKSFLPAMITVDPDNDRVYVMDTGVAKVAAYHFDQASGALDRRWIVDQRTLNFSTLIGPVDRRVFVATDVDVRTLRGLSTYETEAVVFRDTASGAELARSPQLPKMSSGALVTPGHDGAIFYLGLQGEISRLEVVPAAW
ncbi:MAG: hypothetical protein R3B09_31835 [Nannocystaceae bacterium]